MEVSVLIRCLIGIVYANVGGMGPFVNRKLTNALRSRVKMELLVAIK